MATDGIEFSDDFERLDAEDLGASWDELGTGAFKIRSGAAEPDGTATQVAVSSAAMSTADHWAEWTIGSVFDGSFVGLVLAAPALGAALTDTGAYYTLMLSGSTGTALSIRRKEANSSTVTNLASGTSPTDARIDNTVWRFERQGDTLRGYIGGAKVVEFTDTTPIPTTQRRVGMHAAGATLLRIGSVRGGTLPADTTAPTVPTGLTATVPSATQVDLSWTASTDGVGVASYRVMRDGVQVAASVAGTTWSDTTVAAATAYSYTVSAVDAAGNRSAESTPVSVTAPATPTGIVLDRWDGATLVRQRLDRWDGAALVQQALSASGGATADTTAPSTPTGLTATPASSSRIDLAWTASTDDVGVDHYVVYRDTVAVALAVTATSYFDTGLTASTAYNYTVSAVDAAGNQSVQSTAASATTTAASGTGNLTFATDAQIVSLSTTSAAALRVKDTADNVKNGTYVAGVGDAGDIKTVNTRAGSVALSTAMWWKATGDATYLAPLKTFILGLPKPPDTTQALNEWRGLFGVFAAVKILKDAGQWDDAATCPNHNNDTWWQFLNGGGSQAGPYHTRIVGGNNLGRSLRGTDPIVDKTANNWGAVGRATHLMWAVLVGNQAEIDHSVARLKQYLGDQSTGLAAFQPTSDYDATWDNWAPPSGSVVAGIGKTDVSRPGLDGVVIDDICRGVGSYDPNVIYYGADGGGLTYPLEAADYVWAHAAVLINGGYAIRTWGEGGNGFDRMNQRFARRRVSGEQSLFDYTENAYALYRSGRFVASALSQADYDLAAALATGTGTAGLPRAMPLGDWLAPADGSSTWGRP